MSDDLVVGATFASRYRIARRIAAGGMGSVYEVVHLETNRRRALKVMHPDFVQNDESRDRFRLEARVTAQVESEYIVDVFDAGIDELTRMPYLVMELLQGEEISKRIKRLERLSPHDTVLYLHQAALALDKTHRSRIVHRDLKPENLYLCEREDGPPRIKLLDFGIAKIVAENAASTNATQAVGTPLYMAPEQFLIDSAVSPATDLYALGMIAYTMLVGQPYWFEESKRGANVFAFAAYATLGPQEAATARAHRCGVALPPAFDGWFARATAKKPTDRFPTATAMVAALSEALGLPPPAAIVASAYVQGAECNDMPPQPDRDRASQHPESSTASQLGTATTTKGPWKQERPIVVLGGGFLAICAMLALLYIVVSSPTQSDTRSSDAAPANSALPPEGLPEVVPIASEEPTAPIADSVVVEAMPTTSASEEEASPPPPTAAPAPAPAPARAPAPRNTTVPTKKKGPWIRD
ncbi:MAG: protein kinase [Polyangiaceae bacterium]|nr:protein kinase [Polyangiaceae bacterium]